MFLIFILFSFQKQFFILAKMSNILRHFCLKSFIQLQIHNTCIYNTQNMNAQIQSTWIHKHTTQEWTQHIHTQIHNKWMYKYTTLEYTNTKHKYTNKQHINAQINNTWIHKYTNFYLLPKFLFLTLKIS